uniref:HTH myb-type domain-containing protein n=1 Tax=Opuntia streptacantha TaxID=393608 RepID=A0A7C9ES73_OPUST
MSSAQLWSPRGEDEDNDQSQEWQPCKYGGDGGAFGSFTEASGLSPREEEEGTLPGLSLVTPAIKTLAATEPGSERGGIGGILPGSVYYTVVGQTGSAQNKLPYQTTKKRRRCWSPELHRRFVDALEKLGGSQVATPKQIRELMKVDGLTNDEVKSHLQKYRLHVRKLPAACRSSPSSSNDIAMGQDRLGLGCLKVDLLQSSSPEGPLHLGRSGKCNSTSMEDDHDNDNNNNDDNSDGHSWDARHRM